MSGIVSRPRPEAVLVTVAQGKNAPMDVPSGKADAPGWMVMHPEAVARIVEESLRDDAWWVAARTGRFVGGPTVWADCVRPPSPAVRPRLAETEDGSGPG